MLTTGSRLGPYEIVSPLGAGGMGEVYRARDPRLGREVAIKVLPEALAEDAERRSRFEREARTVAALNHPNVVAIYDVGAADGRTFLVSELVAGVPLRDRVPSSGLGGRRAAAIGAEIAEGLAAAHARGIVHRDVKPDNIIVGQEGTLKIIDFGIARNAAPDEPSSTAGPTLSPQTAEGVVIGTPAYMAPEQARGARCDSRTDVFALGCVLFEIATGERAFPGATTADTIAQVLNADPAPRLALREDVPGDFGRIVARCLEKDPARRFQSMADLAFTLRLAAGERDTAPAAKPASPRAAEEPATLAVLPFANRSPDPEDEYFADGMTEELIGALSRIPRLRVASRTTVFALKGRFQDIRALGRELGAAAILEGSVRRAGTKFRVSAQLTDVADGFHLWSDTFDGELQDVFAVQDAIGGRIARVLRDRLGLAGAETPLPRRRETNDVHAYQLYWQGRHLWGKRTPESRMRAVALFEQAIAADPGYARAYAGLADCFLERGGVGLPAGEVERRARAAVVRALELDDSLAQAHTSLGRIRLYYDRDWSGAEKELLRAVELDNGYAEGHHSYSHFLLPAGRVEESLEASIRAREIEPLDLGINTHLAWHFLYSGDFDRAVEQCRFTIEIDPSFFYAHFYLGMALEQRGDFAEALAELDEAVRLSPESAEAESGRIHRLAGAGRIAEARDALSSLGRRTGSSIDYEIAVARIGLGDRDGAVAALVAAAAGREERIVDVAIDPRLRPLHGEPRFRALVASVGAAPPRR
jgi:TolB-like protein/tetratricopeptide (TPR) repeat protein